MISNDMRSIKHNNNYEFTTRKHSDMSNTIPSVAPISNYSYSQTYTNVVKNSMVLGGDNQYRIIATTYTITVYDNNGKLSTYTNNSTREYTV